MLTATVALAAVAGLTGAPAAPASAEATEPLFASGFGPDVAISGDLRQIVGADSSGDNWSAMGGWVQQNQFQYLAGQPLTNFVNTDIITTTGPLNTTTKVLRMTTYGDDPNFTSLTRNELSLYGKPPPNDFREGAVRYWTRLPTDMATRFPTSQASPWWTFMEWKEPDSGVAWTANQCAGIGGAGGTNNYRININIERDAGSTQFYWRIMAEQVQPCRIAEWIWINRSVPVPMNRWFKVEAYLKKHATDGRLYFAVYDGVTNRVVLDTNVTAPIGFTGRTQHRTNPLPLAFWSPFKVYHHEAWWNAGPTTVLYDEFRLFSTFPTG